MREYEKKQYPNFPNNQTPVEITVAKIRSLGAIIAALIGTFGAVVVAYVGYLEVQAHSDTSIDFTQTAVAEMTNLSINTLSLPTLLPTIPFTTMPPASSILTTKAIINSPVSNSVVDTKAEVHVKGSIQSLGDKHAFLLIQSTWVERIYPQHDGQLNFEIIPDNNGQWSMRAIYATSGAAYKAYIVATDNQNVIDILAREDSALYGLEPSELPLLDSMIISEILIITAE